MLRIATRRSPLALCQAEFVARRLREAHPGLAVELLPLTTEGDRRQSGSLAAVGRSRREGPASFAGWTGKGLFVKELEQALCEGRAELAVHSMKDVPARLPTGLCVAALLPAEDPRDVLVSRGGVKLAALPAGARIGTSSLRRRAQLARLRPDLRIIELRGNLGTRLRRLDAGELDALVLAHAGLRRLGLEARIAESFDVATFVPAIGQGVIGVEIRDDDRATAAHLAPLHDSATATRLAAERAFGAGFGASCTVPVAAYATVTGAKLHLDALIAAPDGSRSVRDSITGPAAQAAALGAALAARLLAAGGRQILAALPQ